MKIYPKCNFNSFFSNVTLNFINISFLDKNTKKMSDFVLLNISSTISQYGSEKRFAKDLLISEFKVSY